VKGSRREGDVLAQEDLLEEIQELYHSRKDDITNRLSEFRRKWRTGSEEDLFIELVFCILTPQSKARCCWTVVERILEKDLLWKGDRVSLAHELNLARFKHKKAEYIVEARKLFSDDGRILVRPSLRQFRTASLAREWLVRDVRGIGYKEASHFLRNIGFGRDLAILDAHILRNLQSLGVIETIPASFTKQRYLRIERKMQGFTRRIGIPLAHLDLVLWCRETGDIFK